MLRLVAGGTIEESAEERPPIKLRGIYDGEAEEVGSRTAAGGAFVTAGFGAVGMEYNVG